LASPSVCWVNCCWPHQHSQCWFQVPSEPMSLLLFFSRLLDALKLGLLFNERSRTTAGHSPSIGSNFSRHSLTNWPSQGHSFHREWCLFKDGIFRNLGWTEFPGKAEDIFRASENKIQTDCITTTSYESGYAYSIALKCLVSVKVCINCIL
jgi:hypothetical protein